MVCKVCNKIWDYREKYDFFAGSKDNMGQKNAKECVCDDPIIVLKETSSPA